MVTGLSLQARQAKYKRGQAEGSCKFLVLRSFQDKPGLAVRLAPCWEGDSKRTASYAQGGNT